MKPKPQTVRTFNLSDVTVTEIKKDGVIIYCNIQPKQKTK